MDQIRKDNLTDLANNLPSNNTPQSTPAPTSPTDSPSTPPATNLSDNQVVGPSGDVIDLGQEPQITKVK